MRPRLPQALPAFVLALAACGGSTPRTTSLRVQGADGDASVTIDDRYIGVFAYVAEHGVAHAARQAPHHRGKGRVLPLGPPRRSP